MGFTKGEMTMSMDAIKIRHVLHNGSRGDLTSINDETNL